MLALWIAGMAWAGDPVRGITVSTPTYGPEWGRPEMDRTLALLAETGVNWVTYHPYARIHTDGRVEGGTVPAFATAPIEIAHRHGLKVMVKPHLAHWGSGFSWRGAIRFDDPEDEDRFFREYQTWIVAMADACSGADAFVVGTELDGTVHDEASWRSIVASIRKVNPGHLTYASNWDAYERVPFWDALDAVGIQAYFPLTAEPGVPGVLPTVETLDAGWDAVFERTQKISAKTGKPVVFTELGYDTSWGAAHEPWKSGHGGERVQERVLAHALKRVDAEPSVVGAFLWKWFPGEVARGDFRLTRPAVRQIIEEAWSPAKAEGER